ncbi:MAG: hypothetical protein JWP37_1866 [Mucilaginibacter sp.]|nr:hypothetical protein [Mucilaginibacter sp.]
MKVKIRKYEQLLIALLALMAIINYVLQRLGLAAVYVTGFEQYNNIHHSLPFNYAAHMLLPRIGVVLLFMAVYFWVNLFTIPQARRASYRSFFIYPWVLFQILALSYLLAIGVNVATWYAHPAWNNYGEFGLFAFFGYNETPLTDLWAGFDSGLIFLLIYGTYAAIREFVIYRIENPGPKSNYRILIANQIAASFCIFLLLPALASYVLIIKDDSIYRAYFVFIPSVIFIYFSNTYWLFPRFANTPGISFQFMWRLVISTLFYAFPWVLFGGKAGVVMPNIWLINWIVQLAIVAPITWMLYLQRKDKILQLRGVEEKLAHSKADLQFLRTQINPHFLFNALNTLYGTALLEGSKNTAEGIQQLGDMMRFMLHENTMDFIDMSKEIAYLKNYISLQKLRTQASPEIIIEDNITEDGCNYKIAPMLLIPFVENAFKHGVRLAEKSWIKIKLDCGEGRINFEVRNSVHQANDHDPEKEASGIGLKNVKERLLLLYQGKHQFVYGVEGDEFIARLSIQPHIKAVIKPMKR